MYVDPDCIKRAKSGDHRALYEVLAANLAHLEAMADLLSTAAEEPDSLKGDTIRNASWWMADEAAKARGTLEAWHGEQRKGGPQSC